MGIGTPAGSGAAATAINDGVLTGQKATVAQFHNQDNQAPGGTAYGLLTGGVAQLLNIVGNLDRQRETGIDGIPAVGVSTGSAQFAMAFQTTDATDNFAAGARTFTPAAMSGVLNGVAWSIQAGSVLVLDSGANAEAVVVTAVTATTFTCTTTKAHNGTVTAFPITGFVYNQERDVAGELDGATGSGTAVAAEYEWNGNPPANGAVLANTQLDRARNLNGKGVVAGSLANNPLAVNSTTLTLNAAPTTLQPGQKILLDRAGANPETNYVAKNYVFGSTTVPLQIATSFSHAQNATVEWDAHAPLGPGLNGFLPDGIGIEEEALWDPITQKFYIERAGTTDNMPMQNVVAESEALFAGSGYDRARSLTGKGIQSTTLNGAIALNATSVVLTAVTGLQPGMLIMLAGNTPAQNELVQVSPAYAAGALTVPIVSMVPGVTGAQFAHNAGNAVQWDVFNALGPGLSGFMPNGLDVAEDVVYDPVSNLYYVERSATQDAVSGQGLPIEVMGLQTGTATFDRMRTPSIFKPQNAVSIAASPGTAIWTPAAGKKFRLMRVVLTSSVAGNLVLTDASGGTVIAVIPVTAAGAGVPFDLGNGYLSSTINNALFAFNSGGAATISGTLVGIEE